MPIRQTREIRVQNHGNSQRASSPAIFDRYHIRYIVVGMLEWTTYNVSETKFQQHLAVLFQAGNTVVYGVP